MADDRTPYEPPAPYAPYVSRIDRRTALAWIGAMGASVATGASVTACAPVGGVAEGYGTDPKLNPPAKAPWPRLLGKDELQAAALLADFILPAGGAAPSASQLGVPDFIDEWISAPYPDQVKDRPIIRDGLAVLMGDVLTSDAARRAAALAALPHATDDKGRTFFKRFRALTVGAYYTTEDGFKDIGYIGNVARASDPGPSNAVKAALQVQFDRLGL